MKRIGSGYGIESGVEESRSRRSQKLEHVYFDWIVRLVCDSRPSREKSVLGSHGSGTGGLEQERSKSAVENEAREVQVENGREGKGREGKGKERKGQRSSGFGSKEGMKRYHT